MKIGMLKVHEKNLIEKNQLSVSLTLFENLNGPSLSTRSFNNEDPNIFYILGEADYWSVFI